MGNFLHNLGKRVFNIVRPRARLGLLSLLFIIAGAVFLTFIFGEHAVAASFKNEILGAIGELFLWFATKFMAIAVFLLRFVIEIASYNHYINADAVGLGWVLVRDVTNMFFVIILMVIAFGTVLGVEQYEWKKMLVKFVFAAILVNFSRVICGVMIDAAQVFMMTFISGVAATAGGNLVNALSMENIMAFSPNTDPEALTDAANIVASCMLACVFAFASMVIIGAYMFMLLARVIALWILIILSPLAFVLGIIPKFQSYSQQWWSEFTNNVISGPIIAFFLWLSFAVAGGGTAHNEFTNEGNSAYPTDDAAFAEAQKVATANGESGGTNTNAILDWENLANFIIAIGMLMAGLKITQKLGAAGAGAMGVAGGAVKSFATVASGAAAAKWGAQAIGKGAKAVALAPAKYVGGKLKEKGESLKLSAQLGVARGKEFWNRQMVERGMHAVNRGAGFGETGKGVTSFAARLLQFGTTGQKIKTKKDMLEKREKLYETSIIEPKGLKARQAELTVSVEEVGKQIKEGIVAKRMKAAREVIGQQTAPDSAKGKLVTMAAGLKAEADLIALEHKREEEVRIGEARDVERGKKNESPIFEDVARAQHQAEDAKFYSNLPQEKVVANILNQRQKVEDKKIALQTAVSPKEKQKIEKDIQDITKDLNDQIVAAIARGGSFCPDAIMKGFAHDGEFKADNPVHQQALVLSALTQTAVDPNDTNSIRGAIQHLEKMYGSQFNAFSTHLAASLKAASMDGSIDVAGLLKINDNGEGYRLADPNNKEDKEYIESEREYALSKSRGEIKSINFAVDQEVVGGKVQMAVNSDAAVKNLAKLMPSNKLGMSRMSSWIVRKIENALENTLNTKPENIQQFVNAMRKLHTDDQATRELFSRMSDETKGKLESLGLMVQSKAGKGGEPGKRVSVFRPSSEDEADESTIEGGGGI
jgi:microcompartment protein CcmK/EutM